MKAQNWIAWTDSMDVGIRSAVGTLGVKLHDVRTNGNWYAARVPLSEEQCQSLQDTVDADILYGSSLEEIGWED